MLKLIPALVVQIQDSDYGIGETKFWGQYPVQHIYVASQYTRLFETIIY